jgi:8-amino-7-oxononanoate synthase
VNTAHDTFDWMDDSARRRRRAGLDRTLVARSARPVAIDLAGNDYLGLARHPEVTRQAAAAALAWGGGATGARLVTGTTELHLELERELAGFCGCEAALVFSSGYLANLGVLTALCRRGTLIVADAFNHASLIDGYKLAGGEVRAVPHGDVAAVDQVLAGSDLRRALVVTESIFSVDGDLAPLVPLADVARRHGAALLVDEAHAIGSVGPGGRGAAAELGLAGEPDVVITLTLSKALGAQGGAVLGPRRVVEHVMNTARSFLYDAALAPAATGAALAALRLLRARPELAERARRAGRELSARLLDERLPASRPDAAVVSVRAPSPDDAVAWARACRDAGVAVGCFRPPSVPDQYSRLRLSAPARLSDADLATAVKVISATRPPTLRG